MTVQHVFSRISAMEDATVGPEGFMSALCSSMVNVINRMGYEAVKAKSISLHEKRTQIKYIKPQAPRQTPRPAQMAMLKGWESFSFPVLLPSLTLFQSLASMAYFIYRYIINQSIFLSIFTWATFFFPPSALFKLKSHSSGCPSLAIFYLTGSTTTSGSAENPASELPSQFSFYRDTVFHFVWKILHCFELPLLDSETAI